MSCVLDSFCESFSAVLAKSDLYKYLHAVSGSSWRQDEEHLEAEWIPLCDLLNRCYLTGPTGRAGSETVVFFFFTCWKRERTRSVAALPVDVLCRASLSLLVYFFSHCKPFIGENPDKHIPGKHLLMGIRIYTVSVCTLKSRAVKLTLFWGNVSPCVKNVKAILNVFYFTCRYIAVFFAKYNDHASLALILSC